MPQFRAVLQYVAVVSWALWFGATIATFVFISYFFAIFPRDVAGNAGMAMFHIFGRYELGLAGAALLATGLLLVTFPSKGYVIMLASLVMAGGMAVTFSLGLTPRMEALRHEERQTTPEFKKLHGKSMVAMMGQSILLLFAGGAIVLTLSPIKASPIDLDDEDPDFKLRHRRGGLSQRV